MGLELEKHSTHTETKQDNNVGARAWHVLMTSQSTKEGGMGIYIRGFPGIMREAQLGITVACYYTWSTYLAEKN